MDRAAKREGMHLGMEKVGFHPIEQMRNQALYGMGQQRLLQEAGFKPGDEMRAFENEDYYKNLRSLYDKHIAPMRQPAAEKPTKVLSVSE
mgnify:CR=1 FL=1